MANPKKLILPNGTAVTLRWCDSFVTKLRGFMFRRNIGLAEGLVLVEHRPSITNTSIHMMFVFTPLAVYWLDQDLTVVHAAVALPWRPYYAAPKPAKYVVELHPSLANLFMPGDRLTIHDT